MIKMDYKYYKNLRLPTCKKPELNEANLKILKWGLIGTGVAVSGGVAGAYVLPALGFGSAGVTAGSLAAGWQGPAVAAGSAFAICQSLGATGLGNVVLGAVGTAAGGAGALYCATRAKL